MRAELNVFHTSLTFFPRIYHSFSCLTNYPAGTCVRPMWRRYATCRRDRRYTSTPASAPSPNEKTWSLPRGTGCRCGGCSRSTRPPSSRTCPGVSGSGRTSSRCTAGTGSWRRGGGSPAAPASSSCVGGRRRQCLLKNVSFILYFIVHFILFIVWVFVWALFQRLHISLYEVAQKVGI